MDTGRRKAAHRSRFLNGFHPLHGLAFLLGLLAVYVSPALPAWPIWPATLVAIYLIWRRQPAAAGLCLAFWLGALWLSLVASHLLDARWPAERHAEDVWVQGVVADMPQRRDGHWRFLFNAEQPDGLIRVSWYRGQARLEAGQCWRLRLRMRAPRGSVNPGGFDYEGWLFASRIIATAYVRKAEPCATTPLMSGRLSKLRQRWAEQVTQLLDGHARTAQVLALSLGIRDRFSQADWTLLRHTGTSHLMAISGLHIGIAAGWLYFLGAWGWRASPGLMRRLPAPRAAIVFSAAGAIVYALLSGFELPAQRALIMLLAFYIALFRGRRISPAHLLALAMLLVLLLDPFAAGSAGFWLSFAAVGWIFYLLRNRWQLPGRISVYLRLQALLGLTLVPLTLFWFGEASWVAPLANLLLIPLFTCLVPVILLGTVLAGFWPAAATLLLTFCADVLTWVWVGLEQFAQLASPVFAVGAVSVWAVISGFLGLLWLTAPRGWPARYLGLVFCIPLVMPAASTPQTGNLRLTILDVGQGLSAVVETVNHVLVFDAGPAYDGGFDAGAMVVVPYLRSRGHGSVNVLVQSHTDLDHRGGMPAIEQAMKVEKRYGFDERSQCRRGMKWQWDAAQFEFLHPDDRHWSGNNGSCVLKVTVGEFSILLTGDIEMPVERHLLANQGEALDADVLVVPHHGSASSSSRGFVEAVSPQVAIFSAGWRNRWSFPKSEVLERYRKSQWLSTAQHGAVQLDISADEGIRNIRKQRQQSMRLWRAGADPGWR